MSTEHVELDSLGPIASSEGDQVALVEREAGASIETDIDELAPAAEEPAPAQRPLVRPEVAVAQRREGARFWVALVLALGFVLICLFALGAFVGIAWGPPVANDEDLKKTLALATFRSGALNSLLQLVLTPLIGLVGTMLGFYFGRETDQKPT